MSDVMVTHVKTGMWFIEDIGIEVPSGIFVTIPADAALRSKDLWRAISQRVLFQFHPGSIEKSQIPPAPAPVPPKLPSSPEGSSYMAPETLLRAIEGHGQILRDALEVRDAALFAILAVQQEQIGSILKLLRERPATVMMRGTEGPTVSSDYVSEDIPMFMPTTIKPKDVESHVSVHTDAQEGSSVADAGKALRRLRKNSDGQ